MQICCITKSREFIHDRIKHMSFIQVDMHESIHRHNNIISNLRPTESSKSMHFKLEERTGLHQDAYPSVPVVQTLCDSHGGRSKYASFSVSPFGFTNVPHTISKATQS